MLPVFRKTPWAGQFDGLDMVGNLQQTMLFFGGGGNALVLLLAFSIGTDQSPLYPSETMQKCLTATKKVRCFRSPVGLGPIARGVWQGPPADVVHIELHRESSHVRIA